MNAKFSKPTIFRVCCPYQKCCHFTQKTPPDEAFFDIMGRGGCKNVEIVSEMGKIVSIIGEFS